jgi:hypothetical protein
VTRDLVLFAVCLVLVGLAFFHATRVGLSSWELVVDVGLLFYTLRTWQPWRRR